MSFLMYCFKGLHIYRFLKESSVSHGPNQTTVLHNVTTYCKLMTVLEVMLLLYKCALVCYIKFLKLLYSF